MKKLGTLALLLGLSIATFGCTQTESTTTPATNGDTPHADTMDAGADAAADPTATE